MAGAVLAKGSAVISINAQETEARLVFTPDSEAEGWDPAAINKLASESQLGAYPNPKDLEAFLSKAARAKTQTPLEMVYAQGIEPEAPKNEQVSWEALPIPDDMAPLQDETLGKAKAPEIYRIKIEKIKHEKKVAKAGALSFMPGKEEVSVSWEKKETREKVDVDPGFKDIKYADKGVKLGTITPSIPGKAGKNIFGRPIQPKFEDGTFFLGNGIYREKNDLLARVSGFVRIGENWADIVPLARPSYSISTGIDGITLFLNFEPGDKRFASPKAEEIIAAAIEKGAAENSLVGAEEIDKLIAEAVKTSDPIEAFALFQPQEAEARVEINTEKTSAILFLRKGVAGALPLEIKAINQALKDSPVQGYDLEELKSIIHTFMEGKELELKHVLAEGFPSTRGKDRKIEVQITALPKDTAKPVLARLNNWHRRIVSENGEFDPKEEMALAFVDIGAVIAKVSEGSEGEPGKDIYGNTIPGLPGNDPDIKLLEGLSLRGSEITAAQEGLLLFQGDEKHFRGEVIDYQDAKIGVHVSEDAMEAKGDFFLEKGAGIPLNVDNVKKVLSILGIKKGIDWEGVEKACVQARAKGDVLGYVLARGELPIARGGSSVKWLVTFNSPELSQTNEREDAESTNSGTENRTVQIKAGVPIAELSGTFPEGRPGYDVKGAEIPIDKGTALVIDHDESIRELPLGKGKRLVAARSGELSFDGKKLKISSIKTINGDTSENIKFSGEIQIKGNVLSGSVVMGGSHVTVDGLAEEAFVSAGGKAVVTKGFKGGGRGILRARAGIVTAFVERAAVMAMGDVHLNKGSILSSVKTNGRILIEAENGKLSGGIYQARYGIAAADVGSEKGVRTEISFGQDYFLKDQIGACEEEIAKTKNTLSKTEEKINEAHKNKLHIPEEVLREKVRLVKLLEQFNLKVFTLREKFEEHFESEIRVNGAVFPGVVIESHNRYYEVKQKRSRVIFYFDRKSGRIKEKPME
jgi:uncharacterized protein (DUF342 family)